MANLFGPDAKAVYGQANFFSNVPTVSVVGMSNPNGLALGLDGNLFVADEANNRILVFPPIPPSSSSLGAIGVLGQQTFETSQPGKGTNQLNTPTQIAYDAKYNCLYVADSGNNRVVRYQLAPPVNNNISSVDVQVTFPTTAPKVILSPKGRIYFSLF